MRYGQLIVGPAGSGKSTYCSAIVKHCQALRRKIDVVNLDPAAESFDYEPIIDIREVINITEIMEDEDNPLGPNGALVYGMEQLIYNLDWLQEQLLESDEDYILFDIPGQIELFTHFDVISKLVDFLQNLDFRICGVFLLDSQFITDVSKFISASFVSLSTMINIQIPFVNLLTKVDILNSNQKKNLDNFLEFGPDLIDEDPFLNSQWAQKFRKLTSAISTLLDDYSLIKFKAFTIIEEELINDALYDIDSTLQYGEDTDVKYQDFDRFEEMKNEGVNC